MFRSGERGQAELRNDNIFPSLGEGQYQKSGEIKTLQEDETTKENI